MHSDQLFHPCLQEMILAKRAELVCRHATLPWSGKEQKGLLGFEGSYTVEFYHAFKASLRAILDGSAGSVAFAGRHDPRVRQATSNFYTQLTMAMSLRRCRDNLQVPLDFNTNRRAIEQGQYVCPPSALAAHQWRVASLVCAAPIKGQSIPVKSKVIYAERRGSEGQRPRT